MDSSSSDAASEAAQTLEKESMAAFNQLVDNQLKSFDSCSNSMGSMANGLQQMIQGQISEMVAGSSRENVYRVFQNCKAGNRIVVRNTPVMEGYEIIKFQNGEETTKDFAQALAYSRAIAPEFMKGASVIPDSAFHNVDKTSGDLNRYAELQSRPELVREALEKVKEIQQQVDLKRKKSQN